MYEKYENKLSSQGIHYSRYIASWIKYGPISQSKCDALNRDAFIAWLKYLGLNDHESHEILFLAETGKCEIELDLKKFLSTYKESE